MDIYQDKVGIILYGSKPLVPKVKRIQPGNFYDRMQKSNNPYYPPPQKHETTAENRAIPVEEIVVKSSCK